MPRTRSRPARRRAPGRYDLRDPVGAGGTATVWRAWDRLDRRWLAAKLARPGAPSATARDVDPATIRALVAEQALRHPHPHLLTPCGWALVPDPGTAGTAPGEERFAVLAPLVAGGSLRDLLREIGAPEPAVVADLVGQLLAGLEALHASGWVHRDVTPANVLLEPTAGGPWHARLGDLGIAARTGAPPGPDGVPGTPGFLAPEAGGTGAEPRHDLFAVGVLGLRLVRLGPTPGGARALAAVLATLAHPDPRRRPGSAAEARHDVREAALTLPPAPAPAVPHRHDTRPPHWGARLGWRA